MKKGRRRRTLRLPRKRDQRLKYKETKDKTRSTERSTEHTPAFPLPPLPPCPPPRQHLRKARLLTSGRRFAFHQEFHGGTDRSMTPFLKSLRRWSRRRYDRLCFHGSSSRAREGQDWREADEINVTRVRDPCPQSQGVYNKDRPPCVCLREGPCRQLADASPPWSLSCPRIHACVFTRANKSVHACVFKLQGASA
jgi:hypothetical protein